MPRGRTDPAARSLGEAVDRVFAEDGPLARAVPEFEPRPGQRAMAAAVAEAIEHGQVLLAEAGTGTGKTIAYLVPAILSGRRVLVSTGTKTLQEQIFSKDLPLLEASLGVPFKATYMKGRGNYLCLHRLDQFRDNPMAMAFADVETMAVIGDWAERTDTGDRAELEDLPEDLSVWSDLSAASESCVGSSCPRDKDCFITRMRQRAAESDIVIVNHHLLCADASVRQNAYGEVIPECHVAIIDEAHQLEDVATQYFGVAVSTYRVEDLARDVERLVATGACADDPAEMRRASDRVRDRAALFFQALRNVVSSGTGGGPYASRSAPPDRQRVTASLLAGVQPAGASLADALDGLQGVASLVKEPGEDVAAVGRRAGETRDELAFLLRAGDPDYVYYLETRGRGVFLRASPIDVSTIVRELLIDRMQATVLTSATLSVAGSFDYVRGRLGVREAGEIRLPSEFRYRGPGDSLSARGHAGPAVTALRLRSQPRGAGNPEADRGPRVRPLHQLLRAAGCRAPARLGTGLPRAGPGQRPALGPAPAVPVAGQCRAAGDVELLAGGGRGWRGAELRHRGQAPLRVPGRASHCGSD